MPFEGFCQNTSKGPIVRLLFHGPKKRGLTLRPFVWLGQNTSKGPRVRPLFKAVQKIGSTLSYNQGFPQNPCLWLVVVTTI